MIYINSHVEFSFDDMFRSYADSKKYIKKETNKTKRV